MFAGPMRVAALALTIALALAPRATARAQDPDARPADERVEGAPDEIAQDAGAGAAAADERTTDAPHADAPHADAPPDAPGADDLSSGAPAAAEPPTAEEIDRAAALLPRARLLDARFGEARDGVGERVHAWGSVALGTGTIRTSAAAIAGRGDATLLAPSLGARLALAEEIDVAVEWTVAYAIVHVVGTFDEGPTELAFDEHLERVEASNPTIGLAWSHAWSSLLLQIGLGAAIPVAALAEAPSDARTAAARIASLTVHETLLGMHAAIDPWRFLPERLSFFVPVRIAIGDRLGGSVEIAGGWTIPVLGGRGGHEAALQAAGEIAGEPIPELRLGLRGAIVAWQLGDVARVQPSLEPWARLQLGPMFATVRASIPVAGELGVDTANPTWSIHIGGGAALDAERTR
jgi:hypothetical protein